MAKKYVVTNESGFPTAFYDEDVHGARFISVVDPSYIAPELEEGEELPDPPQVTITNPDTLIPTEAQEISTEQWQSMISYQGQRKFINGEVAVYSPPVNPDDALLLQISDLEQTITPRRIRDAILGTDNGWLAEVESEIETLRSQLS